MTDTQWLTRNLKKEIRQVFEPRYQRQLSTQEVVTIASKLTQHLENYARFKWRKNYEHTTAR